MQITKKDLYWNYAATMVQLGGNLLLLPFALRHFPEELIAIWSVFSTITAFAWRFDFGFNPSFARNVSYIVSGVKELKANGISAAEGSSVDYGLFGGMIAAMKLFYGRIALLCFVLLSTAGTYYLYNVLENYSGDKFEVYIAWCLLVFWNSYQLYTLWYESLMQGMGMIKRSKQFTVLGHGVYLIVSIVLIELGFNIIAVTSANVLSIIIRRVLSQRAVFTKKFKAQLASAIARPAKEVLSAVSPNAVKMGFADLGGFAAAYAPILLGSLYIPLADMAAFGISTQVVRIVASLSMVWYFTFNPKIVQYRVQEDYASLRRFYKQGVVLVFATFALAGVGLVFFGDPLLSFIGSQTMLLPTCLLTILIFQIYVETNTGYAQHMLMTKNEMPFFRASIITNALTVVSLFVMLHWFAGGLLVLVGVRLIVDSLYMNWKWPIEIVKDLWGKKSSAAIEQKEHSCV